MPTPDSDGDHDGWLAQLVAFGQFGAEQWQERKYSLIAAGVAFYAMLALVPALAAFAGIYALFAHETPTRPFGEPVVELFPAQVQDLIVSQLEGLRQTSASAITLGALVALVVSLWSASAAVKHLLDALAPPERRAGYVGSRLRGLGLTVGLLVFLSVAIAAVAAVPRLVHELDLPDATVTLLEVLRWPFAGFAMLLVAAVLYRVAHVGEGGSHRFLSRGSIVATMLWLIGSAGFSLFASMSTRLESAYGSVAAVAITMLWFWVFAAALLVGAIVESRSRIGDRVT